MTRHDKAPRYNPKVPGIAEGQLTNCRTGQSHQTKSTRRAPSENGIHMATCDSHLLIEELKKTIIATTIELMDCGGTTPKDTYEELAREFPELCRTFNRETVIALCEEVQKSELPEESKRFQSLFHVFNDRYFGGQLPTYRIQVVHDVNFWANEYFSNGCFLEEFSYGYIDKARKRIFLRIAEAGMDETLIHEMAHAATNESHDREWLTEMRRLQEQGAPVPPGEFNDEIPMERDSPQLIRLTADQVFRR